MACTPHAFVDDDLIADLIADRIDDRIDAAGSRGVPPRAAARTGRAGAADLIGTLLIGTLR